MIQVIVSGSRHANDDDAIIVWRELVLIVRQEPIGLLVQGGARGVDALARVWAEAHGIANVVVRADWDAFGKGAGHVRNAAMLAKYPEARVLAFPKGKSPGTRDCIAQAIRLGREPRVVELQP